MILSWPIPAWYAIFKQDIQKKDYLKSGQLNLTKSCRILISEDKKFILTTPEKLMEYPLPMRKKAG